MIGMGTKIIDSSVISPEPHYFDTITSKLIEESKSISTDVS
jgi:hypothetical protein